MTRLLLVALAALATTGVVALPSQAVEGGGGANNVVIAQGTADGSSLSRSGLQVAPVGSDTVESSNLAEATSFACTGCRTLAIALQAVLVTRNASTIEPRNAAVATNAGCFACRTYAYAYQYVITTAGPVYLSVDGRQKLAAIRADVGTVAESDVGFDELTARLDDLAARFRAVIDEEAVTAGAATPGTATRRVSVDASP